MDNQAQKMSARDRLWGAISNFAYTHTTAPLEPRKEAVDRAIQELIDEVIAEAKAPRVPLCSKCRDRGHHYDGDAECGAQIYCDCPVGDAFAAIEAIDCNFGCGDGKESERVAEAHASVLAAMAYVASRLAYQSRLRPEVEAFASAMNFKLDRHNIDRGAHGWRSATIPQLMDWLDRYVNALKSATSVRPRVGTPVAEIPDAATILSKAVNAANLAMMIADNAGALLRKDPGPIDPVTGIECSKLPQAGAR